MLFRTSELHGMTLQARDDELGRVKDVIFDDETWIVRYLVADTKRWLPGKKVLLRPESFGRVDLEGKSIAIDLTKKQIQDSPLLEDDAPVSRYKEHALHIYFGWPLYWVPTAEQGADAVTPDGAALTDPKPAVADDAVSDDAQLRSEREVRGYRIEVNDETLGHVHDFLVDNGDWRLRYVVLSTGTWLSGEKRLMPASYVEAVDWASARITTTLHADALRALPKYEDATPIDSDYERRLAQALGGSEAVIGSGPDRNVR